MDLSDRIRVFRSLFKGREDVFAIRWEKGSKSGYMPAYQYDPYIYRLHRMKGGSFKDFRDKSFLPLSDHKIKDHLEGRQFLGIYPLLSDNCSWFIAADFDGTDWIPECRALLTACLERDIPAYLERSRSGKGGHVWIFFDQPYPAYKSRMIVKYLLEESGAISVFDKSASYDRLFPNQDYHSGKRLGNLIALPLHGVAITENNTCFIDPNSLKPYLDQWDFLKKVQRVPVTHLDAIFSSVCKTGHSNAPIQGRISGVLQIRLDNKIHLQRERLDQRLTNFLKEHLSFGNTEYFVRRKTGRSTHGIKSYFNLIREEGHEVSIPRGFLGKLLRFCIDQKIEYTIKDERNRLSHVSFSFNADLRTHQEPAIEAAKKKEFGVIVAPPGSGKTVVGLKIIALRAVPALIIVHRRQLANQWLESIQSFLGIPKREIGWIGQGKKVVGEKITVAMIQSLSSQLKNDDGKKLLTAFGTMVIDECHHIPAETYRTTISQLNTRYQYGLTATPFRKYSDGKLIFVNIGDIISEIKQDAVSGSGRVNLMVHNTELEVPYNPKTDTFETLSKVLVHDSKRNALILKDVQKELLSGQKVVLITERKEHIATLNHYLKQSHECITLSGEESKNSRDIKWKLLKSGNFQILITTGQYFGEGSDLSNISSLFLVYPFSFKGKLIQYIGRVRRSDAIPTIHDYRDIKIPYLNRLFLKRNNYYRTLQRQDSLFDDQWSGINKGQEDVLHIERKIEIPFENLDFQYGMFGAKYHVKEVEKEIDIEVENDIIRPEFEVLKSYFIGYMKRKFVGIHIKADFQNKELIALDCHSEDLDQINREVIASVRFEFVEKRIVSRRNPKELDQNLLDISQIQPESSGSALYDSEEELLDELLRNRKFKHYRQLRFLAARHERSVLKLRFVLSPFSFVFLLKGEKRYYAILETLDTEEATYVWYCEKDFAALKKCLNEVNQSLSAIRNRGRQVFLEDPPGNFFRVFHEYSDDKKGFMVWKDALEERLA